MNKRLIADSRRWMPEKSEPAASPYFVGLGVAVGEGLGVASGVDGEWGV